MPDNKTKAVAVVIFFFILTSSTPYASPPIPLRSVHWLLGDWIADDGENVTRESWTEVSPRTFEGFGESRSRISNALKTSESLRLVEMSGDIYYVAKVPHNDRPIAFKLTHYSDNSIIFENPTHDFPKKLEYEYDGESRLVVTVSDGKNKAFKVYYTRSDSRLK